MATVEGSRTSATVAASRALEHAIDSALAGTPSHSSGTTFVPADLAGTGRVASYRRLGSVSIVDAEGNETRLPQDHAREMIVAALVAGFLLWALARRPRVLA